MSLANHGGGHEGRFSRYDSSLRYHNGPLQDPFFAILAFNMGADAAPATSVVAVRLERV